jgi:SAM-dependent methyltransferase
MTDPTTRFSARADVYAKARPSYPLETLEILREHHRLRPNSVVADLGSGTGIFTKLLLAAAAKVFAVEPNADMRAEAERSLATTPGGGASAKFLSVNGRAESTTLESGSVDLVVAAQAFHWFDVEAARQEHTRILKPGSAAAFVWNDRDLDGTAFLRDYEAILVEHCPGYRDLQGKADTPDKFDAYFGEANWSRHTAPNRQSLDKELLVARVMSSSYAPRAETAGHAALVTALESIFDRYAESGVVTIPYQTVVIGGEPRR